MKTRAAEYVRVSTDRQTLSIETQREAIAAYAKAHQLEIVRTYADEAKSGTSLAGRHALQRLLRDVMDRPRLFTVVLVLDVTRWGRFMDVDESAYHEFHCRKNGVEIRYVAETFHASETPLDALIKNIKRSMAAEYSRELGIKARAGVVQAIERGYASSGLPCIGYRRQAVSSDGTPLGLLAPHVHKSAPTHRVRWTLGPVEEQEAVRRVFTDFIHGVSLEEITRRLATDGVLSHEGKPITTYMLSSLLRNDVVTGQFLWGLRTVARRRSKTGIAPLEIPARNTMVPALISSEVWECAQARIEAARLYRYGMPAEVLAEKLRLALNAETMVAGKKVAGKGFVAAGLPCEASYRVCFGSLAAAYAAAGRPWNQSKEGAHRRNAEANRIGDEFLKDVFALLESTGVASSLDMTRHLINVGGIEVKVRTAALVVSATTTYWRVSRTKKVCGCGWLLLMRLNAGGQSGHDFFLLPPAQRETFSGRLGHSNLPKYEPFRLGNAEELRLALAGLPQRHTHDLPAST